MNNTLEYILKKFKLTFDDNTPMPIEIPNFGRGQLAALFNKLEYKIGAEIGVEKGTYSETLCKAIPGVKPYCIDACTIYEGYDVFHWSRP